MSDLSEKPTRIYRRRAVAPSPPPVSAPTPAPADIYVAAPEARRRSPLGCLFGLVLAGLLLILVGGGAGVAYLYGSSQILPGVQAVGVSLGGQTVTEASSRLQQNWNRRQITLIDGGQGVLSLAPTDLGLVLDAEATARQAYRQGRDTSDLALSFRHIFNGTSIDPVWFFDPAAASARLETVSQSVNVAPVNAGVRFVGGQVEATPAVPGRQLDIPATVAWLQANAGQVVFDGRLPLVIVEAQPEIMDVSAAVAEANQMLTHPLRILAYDPVRDESHEGVVTPEIWAGWLRLAPDTADAAGFKWEVDQTQVAAYLESQATSFGPDRYLDIEATTRALSQAIQGGQEDVRARIYHRPTQHTVQPGQTLSSIAYDYGIPYPWIQQANPEVGDGLYPGQAITIPSPDELLPLPVVESKRIVVSISEQRMWAYENGGLKWEWPISTGIDSSPTAPGIFQVQSHEENAYAGNWDLWMPYFMGIYQPVPGNEFMNGFHGFPTRNGQNLLWTNSLGHKVTYGCILVSNDNAPQLYEWAEEGVIVEVRR